MFCPLNRVLVLGALLMACSDLLATSTGPLEERTSAAPASAADEPAVTITDLGLLAGATHGAATDINNNGLIVGYSGDFPNYCCGFIDPEPHGFLWNPATGRMHDLGVSMRASGGGINSYGSAINDDGFIAGFTREAYFENVHYLFTSEATDVLSRPAWEPFIPSTWTMTIRASLSFVTIPQDMNASRVVVGTAPQAFVWNETAGISALPTPSPGASAANGINDAGEIVGWGSVAGTAHPLRWDAASQAVEDLGLPAGWVQAYAEGVNSSGTITGYGVTAAGDVRSFVWNYDEGFTVLGTLGGRHAWAQGINASGKVVGFSETTTGATHGFVWDPSTGIMLDLGVLPGDSASNAYAINDHDQVVGRSLGSVERPVLWTVTFAVPDTTPPEVVCASPDSLWHAANVSLVCTANDDGSGLADGADASYVLTTSVPAGSESANASTNAHTVCDDAGNCTAGAPIGGNKIDRRPPTVTIAAPTANTYLLGQTVPSSFACADGGSGIDACNGPVASGASFDTTTVGSRAFSVTATDMAGNTAGTTVVYAVAYNHCVLFDTSKAHKAGSTIPIKLNLCDAAGGNVSNASVPVVATGVALVSTSAPGALIDSGNANPDNQFRFADGSYIFNLSLKGFSQGTYAMTFTAGNDPTTHSVQFQVK